MGLSRVRLQTLRRVLSHLRDVAENSTSNRATVENIAKVFGPTLCCVNQVSGEHCFQPLP